MDSRFECQICKRSFTQKSSLIRHSKRCTPGPAPSLRQKSCRQCTATKTKCDLQRPNCSRCTQRGQPCEYIIPMTRGIRQESSVEEHRDMPSDEPRGDSPSFVDMSDHMAIGFAAASQDVSTGGSLDFDMSFAGIDLINDPINIDNSAFDLLAGKDVCPLAEFCMAYPDPFDQSARAFSVPATQFDPVVGQIASDQSSPDANDYNPRDYWLWNTGATKNTPALVTHSMENLLRVMRTWPKALAKGLKTPPMFHISNTHPGSMLWPLVNCVAIAKMWAGQSDGACTEIVRRAALQEMRSLFERYRSMDDRHLIATLQALIMYTLIIMFPARGQMSVAIVDPAVFLCLQRVVNYVAKTGLFLKEEMDCVQPSWESWVHVTAKRRALLTLYLVHWSYSVYHDLESFACHQLGFMPAPAPKFLWEAETREKWTNLYSPWLAQWDDQPYMMSEFASIRPGTGLDPRSEKWLEDADELGNLFFSIVNANERDDPIHDYDSGGILVLTE